MEAYLESFGILNYVKKKKVQESHQFFWNLIFSVAIFHGIQLEIDCIIRECIIRLIF